VTSTTLPRSWIGSIRRLAGRLGLAPEHFAK
jgi:hypothetical protein